jgi:hypothetical protein
MIMTKLLKDTKNKLLSNFEIYLIVREIRMEYYFKKLNGSEGND